MWQWGICLALCLLAVAAVGITTWGAKRWTRSVESLTRELDGGRMAMSTGRPRHARYDSREIDGLPAPVQRYFRAVLKDGQPVIAAVTIDMTGRLNMSPTAEQWKPFTSRQQVVTRRPGFLWNARIMMLPGVPVYVVDGYIRGKGHLHAAIVGLLTMVRISGGGEIARGEFMRFVAETAWYPTALLPSQGVRWEAVDDRSANATMMDGPLTLTLLFEFNDKGLIDSFRAEARGSIVGHRWVMTPWEGRWSDYRMHSGMTVPFSGEVAWVHPHGRRPYFSGTIIALSYDLSP